MRIVLRSLDGLSTSFEAEPGEDMQPPLDSYATRLPPGCGAELRYYDFDGSRRDNDVHGEVVRVYRERKTSPEVREIELREQSLQEQLANAQPLLRTLRERRAGLGDTAHDALVEDAK